MKFSTAYIKLKSRNLGIALTAAFLLTGFISLPAAMAGITINSTSTETVTSDVNVTGVVPTAGNGGAYEVYGKLIVDNNVTFSDNKTTNNGYGGAIWVDTTGRVTLGDGVTFTGNNADSDTAASTAQGGAIYNLGSLTIGDNASFNGNKAAAIGAVFNQGTTSIGHNASFVNNEATHLTDGTTGAFQNQNGTVTIGDNAFFQGNKSNYSGGAYYQELQSYRTSDATTTIGDNAQFINNQSGGAGAVYNYNANENNKASIINIGANAQFINNTAISRNGGAAGNYGGEIAIGDNAVFYGNTAALSGGAIYNSDYTGFTGDLTIGAGAQFINNTATDDGGAIYNSGELTFEGDVVFSGNTANGTANDIHNVLSSSLTGGIVNFSDNSTITLEGGISGSSGMVNFGDNVTLKTSFSQTSALTIEANTITSASAVNLVICTTNPHV